MEYKFLSKSRDYSEWDIEPSLDVNPIETKLFNNDVFNIENDEVMIIDSPTRSYEFHAGVLILQGNKTFGKDKKGRMYYKCIPNDKNLPIFLIPYELRIGFNKNHLNKYVLFSFSNWDSKHPMGLLKETFGDVDNFSSFCNYQLWCKKLVYSISKFNRHMKLCLKNLPEDLYIRAISENNKYKLQDKTYEKVYTIDPENSKDLDDAFSIQELNDDLVKIHIYIANVFIALDTFDLWEHLTKRISTIYLPEERRTMLPEVLSDDICSLIKDKTRPVFTMEFIFNKKENKIQTDSIQYYNALVTITDNFVYEEENMKQNEDYKTLFDITKKINSTIVDSHDVVSHWMIYMNTSVANQLMKHKCGVFRVISKNEIIREDLNNVEDQDAKQTLSLWNSVSGSYQLYSENMDARHDILDAQSYVHITSPIRRFVDIMNQYYFLKCILHIDTTNIDMKIYEDNMDQLNEDTKSIRKVQSECELLYSCTHDESLMDSIHDGIVFNQQKEEDCFKYTVYIKSIRKISYFTCDDNIENYSTKKFKLFLFDAENSGYRKIRLAMQHDEPIC